MLVFYTIEARMQKEPFLPSVYFSHVSEIFTHDTKIQEQQPAFQNASMSSECESDS